MKSYHGLFGVIIKTLTNYKNSLAISVTCSVGEGYICSQRYITRHFFPEITEFITRVPNIITGGGDSVVFCRGVITRGTWHQGTAHIALSFEYTHGRFLCSCSPVKIRRRRNLFMSWRSRQRPIRYFYFI